MKKISACPGWLELSEDRRSFIFLPDRANILKKIFELSIGGLGSYAIANVLNQQKVPPFGPSPTWDHTTIDSMLRNRATLGEHQPRSWAGGNKKGVPIGQPIAGYYPPVVDAATFEAAQIARKRNLASGRGRKGKNFTNIFKGLTTCFYCSSPVKFHSNGQAKSLICERVIDGNGCVRAGWSYENFESSILHFLIHPSLVELVHGDSHTAILELKRRVRSGTDRFGDRFEIASLLKRTVLELRVASAGLAPMPTLQDALIRRDSRERRFEICLQNGPTYVGDPV